MTRPFFDSVNYVSVCSPYNTLKIDITRNVQTTDQTVLFSVDLVEWRLLKWRQPQSLLMGAFPSSSPPKYPGTCRTRHNRVSL